MKNVKMKSVGCQSNTLALKEEGMNSFMKRSLAVIATLSVLTASALLSACGGGGGEPATQVVSGTVAVGAVLSGEVSLKDSSNPTQPKTAVIADDGSFAFDVTNMKAPFILQADGIADGKTYRMHSFAAGSGIANVNPLSDVIVASSCDDEDKEEVYRHPDEEKLIKIKDKIEISNSDLLEKIAPLLKKFKAIGKHPIKDQFKADHRGLDGLFDYVNITIIDRILTITNKETGVIIFTGSVKDIKHGRYTKDDDDDDDDDNLPQTPVAPTTVEALGGAGQVTLSWESVGNATEYNVYYATSPGVTIENGTKISAVTTPYIQTDLTAESTFYYIVTAVNSAGEGVISEQVSATTNASQPIPVVPTAPTNVTATGGTSQVTLSWSPVSNATSYNLYYSASSGGVTQANSLLIADVTSPAVLSNLTAGTTYYYIVTAVNTVGEGTASVQVAATTLTDVPSPTVPEIPTEVTAVGGSEQATITWADVAGAASYNLYWSTTTGVSKTNGTKVVGINGPYVKTGLSPGTTYYFIVAAVNSVGESAASNQATASTNAPPLAVPDAPTGVTLVGGANQVTIDWSAVSGATSYNIYWSTTSGVTPSATKITNATRPYVQSGLAASTAYYYIVTAVNDSGQSIASTQVTTTTTAPAVVIPTAPTAVTATGGANQLSLSWSPVAGATSYNLYWSTTSGATTSATKIAGAASPYVLTGLSDGTTYYAIVTAVNSAGESNASAQTSAATTNVATPPTCGSCHAIPPATGEHNKHVNSENIACATCHGGGYSSTTVNAATHMNGVNDVTLNAWSASAGNCTSSCHGSKSW